MMEPVEFIWFLITIIFQKLVYWSCTVEIMAKYENNQQKREEKEPMCRVYRPRSTLSANSWNSLFLCELDTTRMLILK